MKSNFYFQDEIEEEVVVVGKIKRKIIAHNGKIMMVDVYFQDDAIGTEHVHEHEQATYCLEGEFEFTIGDEKKIIKQGDTVYIPPMVNHGAVLITPKGRLLDVFTPQRDDFLN